MGLYRFHWNLDSLSLPITPPPSHVKNEKTDDTVRIPLLALAIFNTFVKFCKSISANHANPDCPQYTQYLNDLSVKISHEIQALSGKDVGSDWVPLSRHLFFICHLSHFLHSDKEQKQYEDACTTRQVQSNSTTIRVDEARIEGGMLNLDVVVHGQKDRVPNCVVERFR
jgi:hypothetical protein